MLRAEIASRRGSFSLEAALEVRERSVMVLVGESGSGKTTLLRSLAGLVRPERGHIEVDGVTWFDGAAGVHVPAPERNVGFVPQDYALFPHLSARENVAFGLRAQRLPSAEVNRRVAAALERLAVGPFAARRPHELSGGQQQRVALARALVLEPALLLLDEPLSALDAQSRRTIRGELRRLLADLPCATIYVTHSPSEALALGEHITVLEAGRVSQAGTREDLMRHPGSPYVAEFLGVNFFRGFLASGPGRNEPRIALAEGDLVLSDSGAKGEVAAVVHPREIMLSLVPPSGSARNVFEGTIEELAPEPPHGDLVRISVASTPPLIAEVTRRAADQLGLRPGVRVFASFKASGVLVLR